jgi:AraC-like DNA-binding protein
MCSKRVIGPSLKKEETTTLTAPILPDGNIEIILNFGAAHGLHHADSSVANARSCYVFGQQEKSVVLTLGPVVDYVGIRFRPGSAYRFFDPGMEELRGRIVPVAALTAALEENLMAQLDSTQTLSERLVSELSMSARQLERRFHRTTGIGQKLFCRILRFKAIYEVARQAPVENWAAAAFACGYYDQSHLIRDFQEFCGTAQTSLFTREWYEKNGRHKYLERKNLAAYYMSDD